MKNIRTEYDAIVVGAGPNGLSAAITLQQAGLSVLLLEASTTVGGGMRTAELTLPHFYHDVCSAIHPLGVQSSVFKAMPLERFGLSFITPPVAAAHPFDDGSAALLKKSIVETAATLGKDAAAYQKLMEAFVPLWPAIEASFLGPLRYRPQMLQLSRFGFNAALPASLFAKIYFQNQAAKGLFAGMSAHSMLPFSGLTSSAIGLVLSVLGHLNGWPMPMGGSQRIANALAGYFESLGGEIQTNFPVTALNELPSAKAILFDVAPHQLLQIAGHRLSAVYRWQLERFVSGWGVYKIDYALHQAVPFVAPGCAEAGTVHLGGTMAEIAAAEQQVAQNKHPEKPFVLLAQQSRFDNTRAPAGKHTAWAYCHVPNGSTVDMTTPIENQIERFAPGFKDTIIEKHVMNTEAFARYNLNYLGGEINGGRQDITQLFTRPALRQSPYRTSARGLYLCSASTPPGGGVHGYCGYHAARQVLQDIFL
ncbi:phytoene desaturase family protein [Runella salmonicolor]|uniref:NAD(P)/FAD-dependent oxidoreductase n=1 Tax=Runella salmonicolor TaxID=2950278 RepID=A0ABT1FXK2_9BACT|nr:NAD(P)/FAD-dependent oxidoreductase [Runella salmonicolor]MCP1386505.1 NAD(P)/FAD-dependent oxidoreductase [Runella salmonicolor]